MENRIKYSTFIFETSWQRMMSKFTMKNERILTGVYAYKIAWIRRWAPTCLHRMRRRELWGDNPTTNSDERSTIVMIHNVIVKGEEVSHVEIVSNLSAVSDALCTLSPVPWYQSNDYRNSMRYRFFRGRQTWRWVWWWDRMITIMLDKEDKGEFVRLHFDNFLVSLLWNSKVLWETWVLRLMPCSDFLKRLPDSPGTWCTPSFSFDIPWPLHCIFGIGINWWGRGMCQQWHTKGMNRSYF